jgi:hypothetical protein
MPQNRRLNRPTESSPESTTLTVTNNGPAIFKEKGVGLEGVVDVLQSNIDRHTHLGEVMLLHKWLDDLIAAAVHAYSAADVLVGAKHEIGVKTTHCEHSCPSWTCL